MKVFEAKERQKRYIRELSRGLLGLKIHPIHQQVLEARVVANPGFPSLLQKSKQGSLANKQSNGVTSMIIK